MPKQKTNRAAAKRFKINGAGKAVRSKSGLRHGMINKNRGRKRRLGTQVLVDVADQPRVLRQLGKR
jgi:large subunit ribosomal protein L35